MPTTLTVADFLSLRMQYKAEQAENEIPAVIEHNFKDGRMVDKIQSISFVFRYAFKQCKFLRD